MPFEKGLQGMIADSLPDDFGNALSNAFYEAGNGIKFQGVDNSNYKPNDNKHPM